MIYYHSRSAYYLTIANLYLKIATYYRTILHSYLFPKLLLQNTKNKFCQKLSQYLLRGRFLADTFLRKLLCSYR